MSIDHSDSSLETALDDGAQSDTADDADNEQSSEVRRGRIQTAELPHVFRPHGLEWTVETCHLDGDREIDVAAEGGTYTISLIAERGWETATISGTIEIPAEMYDRVVAWNERGVVRAPPTSLVVTVDSPEAILRDAELVSEEAGPGTYSFEITLRRDELYGEVELTPTLVRHTGFQGDTGDRANVTGARLAETTAANVVVDQTSDVSGLMCPKRKSFSDDPSFPPASHLVHLVLEGEEAPQLYLNDDHSRVVDVLDTHANHGQDACFRDVAYDTIEAELWPQLVVATATDVNADGEPKHDWQWDVLRQVAEPLYGPGVSVREAAHRLSETVESPDQLSKLQMEIEDFVQSRIGAPSNLWNLLNRIKD